MAETSPKSEGELLEFPCRFPIKAMGRDQEGFRDLVVGLVTRHASLSGEEEEPVRVSPSKAGNFLSVTVVVEAESRQQLDTIYQSLVDCDEVLMAL